MKMAALVELQLTVLEHLFGPKEDGYRILRGVDASGEPVILKGKAFPETLGDGDEIVASGKWQQTARGPQFTVTNARRTLPRTVQGLETWMANARIPGIGKARAKRLCDVFGLSAINKVVSGDPMAIKIIGKKAYEGAAIALGEREREAEVGAKMAEHQIGPALQAKIIKHYGEKAVQIIEERPYRLVIDISGVAFRTADAIAKSSGFDPNSRDRIKAGIVECMRMALSDGHTALHHEQLVSRADRLLYVDRELIESALSEMARTRLRKVDINGAPGWSTALLDEAEERLARNLTAKLLEEAPFNPVAVADAVAEGQAKVGVQLNPEQAAAVRNALSNKLSIITGGPGTGKTKTLEVLMQAWKILAPSQDAITHDQIQIAAPTGRAAQHAGQVTGSEARTIHRLLEYNPEFNGFERDRDNPLEAGLIAIDESSMPDAQLTQCLSEAWGDAFVVFLGDVDQLKSVGPGNVLGDMIDSGVVPCTRLKEIYRQASGSGIALGAAQVKAGEVPHMSSPGKGELVFIPIEEQEQMAERIDEMFCQSMPAYLAKARIPATSIQVLSPGKQGLTGTIELNRRIQQRLHAARPTSIMVHLADQMIGKVGDSVIQLENDYERMIFNGDPGRIVEIEADDKGRAAKTHVDFGRKIHTFEGASATNLALSYALTIHKSQGSEYDVVIIPLSPAHFTLNKRPIIYTGMTRAKRICVFVGQISVLRRALSETGDIRRVTTLATRLKKTCS